MKARIIMLIFGLMLTITTFAQRGGGHHGGSGYHGGFRNGGGYHGGYHNEYHEYHRGGFVVRPYYYPASVWIPGFWDVYGYWIPGHWIVR